MAYELSGIGAVVHSCSNSIEPGIGCGWLLQGNNIGVEGARFIRDSLRDNTSITSIKLGVRADGNELSLEIDNLLATICKQAEAIQHERELRIAAEARADAAERLLALNRAPDQSTEGMR